MGNYWMGGWLDISWPGTGTGTGVTPGRTPWRGKQRSRRGRGVGPGKRGDTGDGGQGRGTEGDAPGIPPVLPPAALTLATRGPGVRGTRGWRWQTLRDKGG